MIKKWLAKIILWALDGRFVPVELLTQARDQSSYYLNRAIVAEEALKISRTPEIRQAGSPVNQMIDIRVPRKVRH